MDPPFMTEVMEDTLDELLQAAADLRSIDCPAVEKALPLRSALGGLSDDLRVLRRSREHLHRQVCTPRLIILGQAGAGKSTALHFLLGRDGTTTTSGGGAVLDGWTTTGEALAESGVASPSASRGSPAGGNTSVSFNPNIEMRLLPPILQSPSATSRSATTMERTPLLGFDLGSNNTSVFDVVPPTPSTPPPPPTSTTVAVVATTSTPVLPELINKRGTSNVAAVASTPLTPPTPHANLPLTATISSIATHELPKVLTSTTTTTSSRGGMALPSPPANPIVHANSSGTLLANGRAHTDSRPNSAYYLRLPSASNLQPPSSGGTTMERSPMPTSPTTEAVDTNNNVDGGFASAGRHGSRCVRDALPTTTTTTTAAATPPPPTRSSTPPPSYPNSPDGGGAGATWSRRAAPPPFSLSPHRLASPPVYASLNASTAPSAVEDGRSSFQRRRRSTAVLHGTFDETIVDRILIAQGLEMSTSNEAPHTSTMANHGASATTTAGRPRKRASPPQSQQPQSQRQQKLQRASSSPSPPPPPRPPTAASINNTSEHFSPAMRRRNSAKSGTMGDGDGFCSATWVISEDASHPSSVPNSRRSSVAPDSPLLPTSKHRHHRGGGAGGEEEEEGELAEAEYLAGTLPGLPLTAAAPPPPPPPHQHQQQQQYQQQPQTHLSPYLSAPLLPLSIVSSPKSGPRGTTPDTYTDSISNDWRNTPPLYTGPEASWVMQETADGALRAESMGRMPLNRQQPVVMVGDAFLLVVPCCDVGRARLASSLALLFGPFADPAWSQNNNNNNNSSTTMADHEVPVLNSTSTSLTHGHDEESGECAASPSNNNSNNSVPLAEVGRQHAAIRQAIVSQTFFVLSGTDAIYAAEDGIDRGRDAYQQQQPPPIAHSLADLMHRFVVEMKQTCGVTVERWQVVPFSGSGSLVTRDFLTTYYECVLSRKDGATPPSGEVDGRNNNNNNINENNTSCAAPVVMAVERYCEEVFGRKFQERKSSKWSETELVDVVLQHAMHNMWSRSGALRLTKATQLFERHSLSFILSQSALSLMMWSAQITMLMPSIATKAREQMRKARSQLHRIKERHRIVDSSILEHKMSSPWRCFMSMRIALQRAFTAITEQFLRDVRRLIVLDAEPQELHLGPSQGPALHRLQQSVARFKHFYVDGHVELTFRQLHRQLFFLQHRLRHVMAAAAATSVLRQGACSESSTTSSSPQPIGRCTVEQHVAQFSSYHTNVTEDDRAPVIHFPEVEESAHRRRNVPDGTADGAGGVAHPRASVEMAAEERVCREELANVAKQRSALERELVMHLSQLNTEIINFFLAVVVGHVATLNEVAEEQAELTRTRLHRILHAVARAKPKEGMAIGTMAANLDRSMSEVHLVASRSPRTLTTAVVELRAALCEDQVRALVKVHHQLEMIARRQDLELLPPSPTPNCAPHFLRRVGSSSNTVDVPVAKSATGDMTMNQRSRVLDDDERAETQHGGRLPTSPDDFFAPPPPPPPQLPTTASAGLGELCAPLPMEAAAPTTKSTWLTSGSSTASDDPAAATATIVAVGTTTTTNNVGAGCTRTTSAKSTYEVAHRTGRFLEVWVREALDVSALPVVAATSGGVRLASWRQEVGDAHPFLALQQPTTVEESNSPLCRKSTVRHLRGVDASSPTTTHPANTAITTTCATAGGAASASASSTLKELNSHNSPNPSSISNNNSHGGGGGGAATSSWQRRLRSWRRQLPIELAPMYFTEQPILWILLDSWDEALLDIPFESWLHFGAQHYANTLNEWSSELLHRQSGWANHLERHMEETEMMLERLTTDATIEDDVNGPLAQSVDRVFAVAESLTLRLHQQRHDLFSTVLDMAS